MGFYPKLIFFSFLLGSCSFFSNSIQGNETSNFESSDNTALDIQKKHTLYLIQSNKIPEAIDQYQRYYSIAKVHDFDTLEQMAHILLEHGARSNDEEEQLLCIYAMERSGITSLYSILQSGISSKNPLVQATTIQFLGQIQEDFANELISQAMHSPFLMVRMEAAFSLASRKYRSAVGQIESLMYKLPKPLWFFFPDMFAEVGSLEAIHLLRKLISEDELSTRLSAILSAAKHQRDDLLSSIRASSTHLNLAEQEASAAALGYLKDLKSTDHLKYLVHSSDSSVSLAAARALYLMGMSQYREKIDELARKENLFAIHLLGGIPESQEILFPFLKAKDQRIRINAALALLKQRDARCIPTLYEVLVKTETDLAFITHYSLGHSLLCWNIYPSSAQLSKFTKSDLQAMSLSLREQILIDCLELSEKKFLEIAQFLFEKKQISLIPLLVHLLENLQTKEAIAFLQEKGQQTGAPLIRTYCNLALYRLKVKGSSEEEFLTWIAAQKGKRLFQFRPMVPWSSRGSRNSDFLLTPEETSRLLIESYEALADRHDPVSINTLLTAIKVGQAKNRCLLAGLLLKAIQ